MSCSPVDLLVPSLTTGVHSDGQKRKGLVIDYRAVNNQCGSSIGF